MMTDLTWNEFCELYYETAKSSAEMHLVRLKKKLGGFDRRVDESYVVDAAVLSALEKTYARFDAARGVKITTYLSGIVHNDLVDVVKKESKSAARQGDIDDVKAALKDFADDDSAEARAQLVPRLMKAIQKLSPSDQVILNYYLEDKSTYVERSAETLNVAPGYVSVRRFRIFEQLPKLMEMTRADYLRFCEEYPSTVLAGNIVSVPVEESLPVNPILPSLDVRRMAAMVSRQL